jgi:hypothetical protein
MADQERERQLDHLLDSLLSQYSAAEPRPGLETRVLARLAESAKDNQAPVRRPWWFIAGAGIAAATAALMIVLFVSRSAQGPRISAQMAQNKHPQQVLHSERSARHASTLSATSRPIRTRKAARIGISAVASSQKATDSLAERPAVFPTPVPLSPQERLMFTYVENTPREEVVAQTKSDDQKEAAAFWAQVDPLPGQRPAITR